jgi:DNA-binding sugar fermentation-stimulating protein
VRLNELIEHLQIIAANHGNVAVEFNMSESTGPDTWTEVKGVTMAENNGDEVVRIL